MDNTITECRLTVEADGSMEIPDGCRSRHHGLEEGSVVNVWFVVNDDEEEYLYQTVEIDSKGRGKVQEPILSHFRDSTEPFTVDTLLGTPT